MKNFNVFCPHLHAILLRRCPFFSSLTSLRWGMSSSYYYFIFSAYGFEEEKRQMLEGNDVRCDIISFFNFCSLSHKILSLSEEMSRKINKNIRKCLWWRPAWWTPFTLRWIFKPQFISPIKLKLEILLRTF